MQDKYITDLETNFSKEFKIPDGLYIKPSDYVYETNVIYSFDYKSQLYNYDTVDYYAYNVILTDEFYTKPITYLIKATPFNKIGNKYYFSSFTCLDIVKLNPRMLFYLSTNSSDICKLSLKNNNLKFELDNYILKNVGNKINNDVFLNYLETYYDPQLMLEFYNSLLTPVTDFSPLLNIPIEPPDSIELRTNYIYKALTQFYSNIDFGTFLVNYIQQFKISNPSIFRNWIQSNTISYVNLTGDYDIKSITKVDPIQWVSSFNRDQQEMFNSINTFDVCLDWYNNIEQSQQVITKLLTLTSTPSQALTVYKLNLMDYQTAYNYITTAVDTIYYFSPNDNYKYMYVVYDYESIYQFGLNDFVLDKFYNTFNMINKPALAYLFTYSKSKTLIQSIVDLLLLRTDVITPNIELIGQENLTEKQQFVNDIYQLAFSQDIHLYNFMKFNQNKIKPEDFSSLLKLIHTGPTSLLCLQTFKAADCSANLLNSQDNDYLYNLALQFPNLIDDVLSKLTDQYLKLRLLYRKYHGV